MQNSLVPADDVLPLLANGAVNDILEETLLLLVRGLATENAIAILDTSYPYPGFRKNGNFRIRSRPRPTVGQPSLAELTFAESSQIPPKSPSGRRRTCRGREFPTRCRTRVERIYRPSVYLRPHPNFVVGNSR